MHTDCLKLIKQANFERFRETVLNYFSTLLLIKTNTSWSFWKVLYGLLILVSVASLTACGNKEKNAGQALVRVNEEEITVLQINDELSRVDVQSDQQETATKQLIESLIDRQLIINEAIRNKIHRTPDVIQAIERAKAKIIEQAYEESITSKITKPSIAEINDYFQKHPEYFTQRKQFDMQQLIIASTDINNELRLIIDSAKSLNTVISWLDKHNIRYARGQLSRNAVDLPEKMGPTLKEMHKRQLFIVNEGKNSLINFIYDIKDSPVSFKNATPQIEQYLITKKSREAMNAEILHLRSLAKIEYLNAPVPTAP
jgi:EpsD family peptidyl-prolyl cis-trans isomerase